MSCPRRERPFFCQYPDLHEGTVREFPEGGGGRGLAWWTARLGVPVAAAVARLVASWLWLNPDGVKCRGFRRTGSPETLAYGSKTA